MKALEKMARACEIYHDDMLFSHIEWDAGLCKEAQTQASVWHLNLHCLQFLTYTNAI